jgi:hypothetical protein
MTEEISSRVVAAVERSERLRLTKRFLVVAAALTAASAVVDVAFVAAALLASHG